MKLKLLMIAILAGMMDEIDRLKSSEMNQKKDTEENKKIKQTKEKQKREGFWEMMISNNNLKLELAKYSK